MAQPIPCRHALGEKPRTNELAAASYLDHEWPITGVIWYTSVLFGCERLHNLALVMVTDKAPL